MQDHFDLSDIEFERQFANCTLDPTLFSHEAHLRLAWIHITKYGLEEAIKNIEAQLKAFVSHVGATDKYHHTLTIAAIHAVHHFVKQSAADTFRDFIKESAGLNSDFKGLIQSHYSIDIFSSKKAKKVYVAPDMIPF